MSWEVIIQQKLDLFTAKVRADVDQYLQKSEGTDLTDLIWTFSVPSDGGLIVIGINGDGKVVKQVYRVDPPALDADIKRLTNRVAFLVVQRVMPFLLRLTPGPPFIAGDASTAADEA